LTIKTTSENEEKSVSDQD